MNRRALLASSASLLALSACGTVTPSQVASDAQLVANAVSTEVTAAEALLPSDAAILAKINGYDATISADAAKLGSVLLPITGNPQQIVQEIVTDTQAVVPILIPIFPAEAPALGILDAVMALLPALLTGVGLPQSTTMARGWPPPMTPEQARLVLARIRK
jgi:hypothetical protein